MQGENSDSTKAATPTAFECASDTLSRKGATALAKRLQDFWHGQGFSAARFWVEPIDERFAKVGSYEVYRVMSNLVNGLPPRLRGE